MIDFGTIEWFRKGQAHEKGPLRLTLVAHDDAAELARSGLRGLRLKRIVRLTREAVSQGMPLGYQDLSALLLTSLATLKRDISHLESKGVAIPLLRRRIGNRKRTLADGGQLSAGWEKPDGTNG